MDNSVNGPSVELPIGVYNSLVNPFSYLVLTPVSVEVLSHMVFTRAWEEKN